MNGFTPGLDRALSDFGAFFLKIEMGGKPF